MVRRLNNPDGPSQPEELFDEYTHYEDDYADVRGQEIAKRAITISAAGGHNLLMLWTV